MNSSYNSLSKNKIEKIKKTFLSCYGLPLGWADASGIPGKVDRISRPLCAMLMADSRTRPLCLREYARGTEAAFAGGEPYVFQCHAGLVALLVPLMDEKRRLGAFIVGPTLPEPFGESLARDVEERLSVNGINIKKALAALRDHIFLPGASLQKAGAFLSRLALRNLGLDMRLLGENLEKARQQARIAEALQEAKENASSGPLNTLALEKELLERVRNRDRTGAKAVLNRILGAIMFRDPAGSPMFKIRLVELLAVISRTALDARGKPEKNDSCEVVEKVLKRNLRNMESILSKSDQVELCSVISSSLDEFLDLVCSGSPVAEPAPIFAVVRHLEENFSRRLGAEELSGVAHLSVSRAAHLFKETYGMSMGEKLALIRVENAKRLLRESNLSCLEVALRSGFGEQAHFTRTFRRKEGMTPRKYRLMNRGAGSMPRL